tara:strand:+ start:59 stop:349 length:291 start_codon:yes stop_codon:yes gene_type:complete
MDAAINEGSVDGDSHKWGTDLTHHEEEGKKARKFIEKGHCVESFNVSTQEASRWIIGCNDQIIVPLTLPNRYGFHHFVFLSHDSLSGEFGVWAFLI